MSTHNMCFLQRNKTTFLYLIINWLWSPLKHANPCSKLRIGPLLPACAYRIIRYCRNHRRTENAPIKTVQILWLIWVFVLRMAQGQLSLVEHQLLKISYSTLVISLKSCYYCRYDCARLDTITKVTIVQITRLDSANHASLDSAEHTSLDCMDNAGSLDSTDYTSLDIANYVVWTTPFAKAWRSTQLRNAALISR